MKKKYIIASLAVMTMSLTGCYDLDRVPADQISDSKFYKNEDHAKAALMAVYSNMKYDDVFGLQFAMDGLGGISMGYDPPSYQIFQRGRYDVKDGKVLNKWRYLYEGIARANNVLQNIDKCDMADALKAQYKGEAKFLRALYYFTLMDFFGGVPIYDESVVVAESYSEMKAPRNTVDQVRDFVLKDLTEAVNALPESWGKTDYGRATKYAAIALQGKVYLYNRQYDKAAECFKTIVDSKQFALYDDYADLFKPGGDESSEMIFAIQNMGGVGTDQGMPMCFYMGSRASFGSCWNNVMVSTSFVDEYECKDGKPFDWEAWFPGITTNDEKKANTFRATLDKKTGLVNKYPAGKEKLLEMYKQRDPRMAASIILPYTSYIGWFKNQTSPCEYVIAKGVVDGKGYIRVNQGYETYLWRKFVPESNMGGAINNRAHTPINFPLIRYADVLLMLAECENELGHQAAAVELINQVRARKSVNMPGINSGPEWLKATTKEEVFARIRHERAVELAGEGHSFSDMKRWKLLEELNGRAEKDMTGKKRYERVVTARDYLWPIPADEIEKNAELKQNPGWG
ncbi:SusD family protein [Hallella bergensis DSM 17361]|uniref:SusD family protein n=1 Tax=Hallella bergensis DSM 17361 TaxID=585502 RepID=D1PZA7_9BACT|nr:RagB/SusD family nutrient uptake outer membrane protein [Hallella bergensis]EFA43341.1 SusD family protein [Hallella bergensis DSM 17361]